MFIDAQRLAGCGCQQPLGATQELPARAFKDGNFSWVDITPPGGRPMRITHQIFGLRGLGVAPQVVGGAVGVAAAIGGLAALIQNAFNDDWADTEVFASHAREIHAAMLAIQCLIGGASSGAIKDTMGHTICESGTAVSCTIPSGMITEWRLLRDGFGAFWAEVSSQWGDPSDAQAKRLKDFALKFMDFYNRLGPVCRAQGKDLPSVPKAGPAAPTVGVTPPWLKWTVAGVAFASVAYIVSRFTAR